MKDTTEKNDTMKQYQNIINNLQAEIESVHEELNRTNSELMQLTIALDERVEERTQQLRESEKNLLHINRLLLSIRNINQAIVQEKDRQKLLEEVCEILVEVTGYSFCVVGLLDENTNVLVPVACWGLSIEKKGTNCMMTPGEPCEKECPAKTVVKNKKPIIINDIHKSKSKKYTSWKKNAEEFGFKSFIAVPIVHGKSAYGYLSVYSTLEGIFKDDTEISLLKEIAGDIGMAFNSMVLEEKRIRAEEEVQKSEEKYRLLADNTLDVIWTLNAQLEFEYVNPAIFQMTGYTREEWIGSNLTDHVDEKDFPRLMEIAASEMAKGPKKTGTTFETVMFKKDRTPFDAEIHSRLIFDKDGKFLHFQGVTRDVTRRRTAERELAERERLLSFAIEQMPVPVLIATAPDIIITRCNKHVVDLLAVSSQEITGIPLDFHKEMWPTFYPDGTLCTIEDLPMTRAIKEGVVTRNQEMIIRQDGKDRWISVSASPLFDKNGDIVAGIVVFPEITDIKEVHEKLHEQEVLLRNIVDTIPACIFVKDREGSYVLVNDFIAEIYDQSPEEMLGKTDRDFIDSLTVEQTDLEKFIRDDLEVTEQQQMKFIPEERFQKPNGDTLWFQTTKIPLSVKGESGYMLGVGIDITERKAAQEALEHSMRSYEAIYNTSTDCIFLHDGQTGEIVDVNRSTMDTFGYTKEEIRRLSVGDLSLNEPPFTQKEALGFIRKAVNEGPQHFEWLAKKKNGELIWFENSLQHASLAGEQRVLVVGRDINDRKQAEAALRKSEEKYRNLVENLSEGIWAVDARGYTTFVNSSMAGMLGYEAEEMTGRHFFRFMNEYWQKVYGEMWEQRRDDFFGEHELEFLKKDGGTVYVYLNTSSFHDDRDTFIGGMAAITDITQRKLAEEELRRSEELFRNLFLHHSAVKLIIDPDTGSIIDANKAAANYYGWPIERLKRMKMQDINTLSPEELRQEMENARTGGCVHFEFRHRRADGSIRDVEVFSSKIETRGKELLHSVIQDITDRKRYENALRESEEKFRNFFETCKDVIYITDVDGKILDVNPAVKDLSGYERDEITGQLNDIIYSDFVDRKRFTEQISRQGFVKDFEVTYKDKEGVDHFCLETATVRRDASGNIVGYQGFIRDNTERVKMQEQLIQAEKLSSLGGILSGVAHELNNPLTSIIGNAQLLERKPITGEIREKLGVIQKESLRCTKIVGGLLAFAREHKPERVMSDINEVIEEACSLRKYELRVDDVSLMTDLDSSIPETSLDPYQMQQVFINLINNAHHALIEKGGGRLKITSRSTGDNIIVDFIDNGLGIPEDIRRKIFDPFFTTKKTGKGTGLGLSICYGIVNEHGGTIEVESNPDQGTCFSIKLPISTEVSSQVFGLKTTEIPRPEESVSVLVIEDEESLRDFVASALEAEGYMVHACDSANRAVEILKTEEFGAIVSDMKMPGMSGQNFYTYLQKHFPKLTDRILFITGDVLGDETQHFFKITGCRYLEKPFEIDDLLLFLGEMFNDNADVR